MINIEEIKSHALKFLISAIIVLCISFLIVSCGRGPKRKAKDANKGPFAVDFSLAPDGERAVVFATSGPPEVSGKELTFEALVKNRTSDLDPDLADLNGGILGYFDITGAVLYVKGNMPKFAIRISATSTPALMPGNRLSDGSNAIPPLSTLSLNPLECVSISVSTTDCIVGAGDEYLLARNEWTHVAGVLVNKAHTHPVSETCTDVVMAQTPHLDFYVDGEFANCATTEEFFTTEPFSSTTSAGVVAEFLDDPIDDDITTDIRFDGVLDELRLWTVARTADQIRTCMDRELNFGDADCPLDWTILKTYWRFNEGQGHDVTDSSGNGNNGGIEIFPSGVKWNDGWVDGGQIIKK
jgi:hypothetical protein